MNAEEISDNRLHSFLQRYIERNKLYGEKLKGIRFCGHTVLQEHNAVFVVTDGERTRYSTLIRCHSAWSCPYCSPRVMANKGTDIACAIDALATKYNQKAAMITFTLPHDKYMSCEDSYQILLNTWRAFIKYGRKNTTKKTYKLKSDIEDVNKSYSDKSYGGYKTANGKWAKGTTNKTDKRAKGKRGEVRECTIKNSDPWSACREQLGFDHFVKVYEFTYGENGWHPHIHLLAWVPKENLQRFTEYEDAMLERWWECARKQATKYYAKKYPDQTDEVNERVNTIYADYKMKPEDGHRAVYISKDKAGKVISQSSSHYISGWSGNMELTGSFNMKRAHNDHLTPLQMLEKACANAIDAEKYMPLYIEYALVTRGHRRVEFSSRTGLTKIIAEWKQSEEYIRVLKKKVMDKADMRPWKVVAWFSREQWYDICDWDTTTDEDIRYTILQLAKQADPWNAIAEYVQRFDVFLYAFKHPKQDKFESQIYENKLLAEQAC